MRTWKSLSLLAIALLAAPLSRAAGPVWLEKALDRFAQTIPPDCAYTVDLTRNGETTSERFDPSQPPATRWTLLSRNGRPPTAEDLELYRRQRQGVFDPAFNATIETRQLDRGSVRIVRGDEAQAAITIGFTPAASDADKMLRHLDLSMVVRKEPAAVTAYTLKLREPYSPVLFVKMHEMSAGAEFDAEGRPVRTHSLFRGRIFFKSVTEQVEARFHDYTRTTPWSPGQP